jgi:hypothetical protein
VQGEALEPFACALGAVLAFITASLMINAEVNAMQTTVNSWSITLKCDAFGNDILLRAACAKYISARRGRSE